VKISLKISAFLSALLIATLLISAAALSARAQDAASQAAPQAPAATPTPVPQAAPQNAAPTAGAAPKCTQGPVDKSYGGTKWLVYGCDDNQSLVIVAAPDNPAAPFYFTFSPAAGHYRLHGEGVGQRDTTTAAFSDLKSLAKPDIEALLAEAKAVKP
jgi:hypothetical protein